METPGGVIGNVLNCDICKVYEPQMKQKVIGFI